MPPQEKVLLYDVSGQYPREVRLDHEVNPRQIKYLQSRYGMPGSLFDKFFSTGHAVKYDVAEYQSQQLPKSRRKDREAVRKEYEKVSQVLDQQAIEKYFTHWPALFGYGRIAPILDFFQNSGLLPVNERNSVLPLVHKFYDLGRHAMQFQENYLKEKKPQLFSLAFMDEILQAYRVQHSAELEEGKDIYEKIKAKVNAIVKHKIGIDIGESASFEKYVLYIANKYKKKIGQFEFVKELSEKEAQGGLDDSKTYEGSK